MHFGNDVNDFNNSNNKILFIKGSKYINWKQLEILADAVEGYATQWLKREKEIAATLSEMIKALKSLIQSYRSSFPLQDT